MKFGIIVGSTRQTSQSSKVGAYLDQRLREGFGHDTYVLDLKDHDIPLWQDEMWQENSEMQQMWQPYSESLAACDGFIIIAPEWAGMVPAALKNIFLYCGQHELAHKPGLIVTVSAGVNGAYPVAELRMNSYKNTYITYLPEHIIVRNVQQVLNDQELDEENTEDFKLKQRIEYELQLLEAYAEALQHVRNKDILDYATYPFGM